MEYKLKRLPESGLGDALQRAEHYRDLNQPEEAESICRDILDVAPGHQRALRVLGLALTDRFPAGWSALFDEALDTFAKLASEYERAYFAGVAWERAAKAQLSHGECRNAVNSLERALALFARAEELDTEARPEAVLRWNRCVRLLTSRTELRSVSEAPRETVADFGD